MMVWYNSLKKSPLTPPAWTFSVVWPILYIMMFISMLLYILSYPTGENVILSLGFLFFILQLGLNLAWSPVFFRLERICLSLLILVALLIFLCLTIFEFYKTSRTAAYFLIPYLVWSMFALYLNAYICLQN